MPCCRIRVLDSSLPAPKNSRAEGMWNLEGRTNPPFWPPHRVINQTADTCGLRLIVLRDETSAPLQGLAPLHPPSLAPRSRFSSGGPSSRSRRLACPRSSSTRCEAWARAARSQTTPTFRAPTLRARFCASARAGTGELVSAVAAETSDGLLMKLLETPLMSSPAPLAEQSTAAQPPPAVAADDDGCELFFSQSDITAMRDDCYVSLPPSPPVTPASLPFASRSWQLPARLGVHASIQVSLALGAAAHCSVPPPALLSPSLLLGGGV